MESQGERIRRRRLELGLTQAQLAAKVGVTRPAVTMWEAGNVQNLDGDNLMALAAALDKSPQWIQTGKDAPHRGKAANDDPYLTIRLRSANAAAGAGAQNDYDDVIGGLKFLARSLRSRNLAPNMLEAIFAKGDSMAPRIMHRDALLVDTSQTAPKHGQVFVVSYEGDELVKRLQRTGEGWALVSDNNATGENPPIPVRSDWRGCRIIGRVVWTGGWMP